MSGRKSRTRKSLPIYRWIVRRWIVRASIAAVLGSMLWMGCGVKSPPTPPQYAIPERITDLSATSEAQGVRLEWERPVTYASGSKMRDLAKFEVDRAGADGAFYPLLEIPVTDQARFQQQHRFSYLDSSAEMDHSYKYRVFSETEDHYRSEASNAAEITRKQPKPAPNPENFVLPQPTPLP